MIWISEFFFCVGSMSIAGTVVAGIYHLFYERFRNGKAGVAIRVLRLIVFLYLFPVAYLAVRTIRMGVSAEDLYAKGYFGINTSPLFIQVFSLVGAIWLIGFILNSILGLRQFKRLRSMMIFNIPVNDLQWEEILQEECSRYRYHGVRIYENDWVVSPMITNIIHPTIVVPPFVFAEKSKRITLEHELTHLRNHDLLWKRAAMVIAWLHWFNPLAHRLFDWLCEEQEAECDMHVCTTTKHFTTKDYFVFVISLIEARGEEFFISGLANSANSIERRLEVMRKRKGRGYASKWAVLSLCLILMTVSVMPAYAMMDYVAGVEEQWLAETEIKLYDADPAVTSAEDMLVEFTVLEDTMENPEVDMSNSVSMYSSMVTIDLTGEANTRYSFKPQYMRVGDRVTITVECSDPSVVFWIGIKNVNTNVARYVEGTDLLHHSFIVNEAGTYRVFVENRSNTEADFLGSGIYPY